MKKRDYRFKAQVWIYPGLTANWHFVSLPKNLSEQIKKDFGSKARGWGSLPVKVCVGKSSWRTSIFPDKKSGTYILPIKAEIRNRECIFAKDYLDIKIIL